MKVLVHCQMDGHLSTIAKGYLQYYTHQQWQVIACGPFDPKNSHQALLAMKEDGIDLSNDIPEPLSRYLGTDFDQVIVIGEFNTGEFNNRHVPNFNLLHHETLVNLKQQLPIGSTGFYRAAQEIIKKEVLRFIGKHQSQLTAKAAA